MTIVLQIGFLHRTAAQHYTLEQETNVWGVFTAFSMIVKLQTSRRFVTSSIARASVWTPVFSALSRLLVTAPAKLAVAALTLGLLGGGVFGTLHLDMEFKPEWLMDHNSEGGTAHQTDNNVISLSHNPFSV